MPGNEPDDLARAKDLPIIQRFVAQAQRLLNRAAHERSRAMRRDVAERLFAECFWPVERVVAWIAYRDPALIEKNWRHSQLYDHPASKTPSLRDKTPRTTLLRALQSGKLRAIKDGTEMPPEAWSGFDGRNWPAVYFRREDVLTLWPDPVWQRRLMNPMWRWMLHAVDNAPGWRRYISFGKIADDLATYQLGAVTREKILRDLEESFRRGEFNSRNKSCVILRAEGALAKVLSLQDLEEFDKSASRDDAAIGRKLFESCWITVLRAEQWCRDRGIDPLPAWRKDATTPVEGSAETPPASRPLPVTQKWADQFAQTWMDGEKAEGRQPTQRGLEAAAQATRRRGGRDYLRKAFHRLQRQAGIAVKSGPPKKRNRILPPDCAKK